MQKGLNRMVKPFVGVRRLELPTSTSRTWRAANCATPRIGGIDRKCGDKGSDFFWK